MNITIEELSSEKNDLESALHLMNRTQGVGLFQESYLTSKIKREDALVLGAYLQGELVGVGCAEMITDFRYYVPFDHSIQKRLAGHNVGSFSSLCVREDVQGKGIGKALSIKRLEWLKEHNCHYALGIAWISGKKFTSDKVFEKIGFRKISMVAEFFKEGAIKYPFECPGCQIQPCICSAALYEYIFFN